MSVPIKGRLCDHLRTNISSSKTYKQYPRPSSSTSYEVTFDESEGFSSMVVLILDALAGILVIAAFAPSFC
jgi:hypothetical protein